ncbi:CheA signal transduction histidine kinase [Candidatus Sulfotelmatomonas gaucii]|uniref:histidine kinase n=1 Tax=Candidatus Sulfuritelmatomonas gaucii TaxID=2043161 RepID=A0A2N9L911_9BACT|nr:CheA signal transduction histidine kinase [Candidatus Sulfotelmatomonas gaucii]
MDDLTKEFLIESQEGLDRMERCLTELEQKPQDAALLAEIFRSVHTIKGTTGFLGFKRLEKLAHSGENLLGVLRDGKLAADAPMISALLELLDSLRTILKTIEAEETEGTGEDALLIGRLDLLREPARVAVAAGARSRANSPREAVAPSAAPAVAAASEAALLVPEPAALTPDPPVAAISAPAADASNGRAPATSSAAESTLRVDVALLNRMMNLVGELVLTRNQVLQATAADANMTLLSRRLDMVTADLREAVMKARMQPVSNVFSKVPRMVRDLSQSLGRRVRLQTEGQETELDKSLLEAIKDPITHAVRNALDHGIELPEVRHAAGKDPEGLLSLRAVQEGSHVIVEISDDGTGIAVEKVRSKAIERKLIAPERATQLSERELLQLIFLPGFSTAAEVTNVSGRGVGMDVVRTNVEKIGGKVEVDSRVGRGTTLRLRIPLTLAIIPALIVRSLNQSFALPQAALSELVHIPPEQAATAFEWIENAPLYRLRGQLLPLVFLDRLLMPEREWRLAGDRGNFIAVLDADGRRFGLVVDSLADPEEIVVKPLSAVLKDIGLYSGATVLGNAELALILDPGLIAVRAGISMHNEEESTRGGEEECGTEAARMDYLLVEAGGRHAAVPLGDVLRIEQMPLSRIEYFGPRPLLNFEGQLLPVEDAAGILAAGEGDPEAKIVVVVCREGNRQMGIAVSHVLDVAAGDSLFEAGSSRQTDGVTLLKQRVTGVINLGGVPPLPALEETAGEAQLVAEEVG